ncbi:MAG: hypothetical protein ACYDAP_10440 [Thermoplasmataceae archaeon]
MQIGNYWIPDNPNRLPRIIGDVKIIYDKYARDEIAKAMTNDALAKLLGFKSSNNGSYQRRLRALREYGFLEGKINSKISQKGETAIYGKDSEKGNAILQAFLSIPLWSKLYESFKKNIPSNDFWLDVQRITGCSPKEAQEKEQFIKEVYANDASVISDDGILRRDQMETNVGQGRREEIRSVPTSFKDEEEVMALLTRMKAFKVIQAFLTFMEENEKRNAEIKQS